MLPVMLLSMLMLLSTLSVPSDLWQQLSLASELESDRQDTVEWDRKWFNFNPEKTQVVSCDPSNNTGAIDMKMDGSALQKESFLRCWG